MNVLLITCMLVVTISSEVWGQQKAKKQTPLTGAATWSWLPDELRDTFAAAQREPWEERPDEVLIPRGQVQWPRYLNSLLNTPSWVDLGVSFRVRFEELTNPFRKGEFGTAEQLPLRTRARLGLGGEMFRFLVEFQDARSLDVDPGELLSTSTTGLHDIIQLFGSMTVRNILGTALRADVHFGRLTMDFGRRRLIARNRFRNTTNMFDGAHLHFGRGKDWHLRAFLVQPVSRQLVGVSDFFGADETLFWGVYHEREENRWLRSNLYYYGLNDRPAIPSSLRQLSTFGFRVSKAPRRDEFDYDGEMAFQVGTVGSTTGNKDHFAYMGHAEVGYAFQVRTTPRLVVQYDYYSGTEDPFGSQSGSFDRLFGARAWELTPTGIFGPFFRSNLSSPGARIFFNPVANFLRGATMMVKYRAWWLAQSRDAWVGSGLQDPTGRSGNFLGQDLELKVTYRPSRNYSFSTGYDHFFKGSYIESLAKVPGNPPANDSNYFYIQTEIRF